MHVHEENGKRGYCCATEVLHKREPTKLLMSMIVMMMYDICCVTHAV